MLNIRWIITIFRTLRMHQIAPFLSEFFKGEHAPRPPSTTVDKHHRTNYAPSLYLSMLVIRFFY